MKKLRSGDLWSVSRLGGTAQRLTAGQGAESDAVPSKADVRLNLAVPLFTLAREIR